MVCGNSDPGTSGLISPFTKMNSLYFNDDMEPCSVDYKISEKLLEKYKSLGHPYVYFDFNNQDEYYEGMDKFKEFESNCTVYGEKLGEHIETIINDEIDIDDLSAPQTKALQKKKRNSNGEIIEESDDE